MESWSATTFVLCLYGFLKEFRPSEPFLTQYLIHPRGPNITLEQAYLDVYPVWTYSYLVLLIAVFLLTDLLRYKVVMVVGGFAYIGTWCLLLWGKGVLAMQVMQVVYGVATSTEVAYYTYIYAKVSKRRFKKVTSFTRVALLVGRFTSGVSAQVLVSTGLSDFRGLNYISLVNVGVATLVTFLLPNVGRSIYFHRGEAAPSSPSERRSAPFRRAREDFVVGVWRNRYVLKWSVWWALATCGHFQVGNYIQPLWETIKPSPSTEGGGVEIYNGAVEAATTLAGAVLSFVFGYVHFNWRLIGEPVIFVVCLLDAALLVSMALTRNIWLAYSGYWLYKVLYQVLSTVSSCEIASNIRDDSYGLVFGLNTFLALAFQTILTVVVADDAGLALPPRTQFLVYGGFWCSIGIAFVVVFVVTNFARRQDRKRFVEVYRRDGLWIEPEESLNPCSDGGGGALPAADEERIAPIGFTEQE